MLHPPGAVGCPLEFAREEASRAWVSGIPHGEQRGQARLGLGLSWMQLYRAWHTELREHSGKASSGESRAMPETSSSRGVGGGESREAQGLEARQLLACELGDSGFCSFSAV